MSKAEKSALVEPPAKAKDGEEEEDIELVPISNLFRFADGTDKLLILLGSLGGCAAGAAMPAFSLVFGDLFEGLNDPNPLEASRKTMDVSWIFLWVAIGMFVTSSLQVGCFELLAERQLLKLRREYFSAVLRLDIAWFDKNGGLDLPSSISGDSCAARPAALRCAPLCCRWLFSARVSDCGRGACGSAGT